MLKAFFCWDLWWLPVACCLFASSPSFRFFNGTGCSGIGAEDAFLKVARLIEGTAQFDFLSVRRSLLRPLWAVFACQILIITNGQGFKPQGGSCPACKCLTSLPLACRRIISSFGIFALAAAGKQMHTRQGAGECVTHSSLAAEQQAGPSLDCAKASWARP